MAATQHIVRVLSLLAFFAFVCCSALLLDARGHTSIPSALMERMNVDFNVTNGTIGPMAIASLVIMVIVNHENWFKLFFVVRRWCTGTPAPEEAWQKEVENQLKNVCGKLADQETASQTAQEKNSGVHQEILAELKQLNTNFSQFTEAINQLNTNFTTANAAREDAVAPARHEHKLISSLFKLRRNRPHSDIH